MVEPTKVKGFVDTPNWCKYWLIIALIITYLENSKVIKVRTDRNVELTMFWSQIGPIPEERIKIVRGAPSHRDPHISWHPFGWITQEEKYEIYPFGIPWIHPDWWHTFTLTREMIPGGEVWFQFLGPGCGRRICRSCGGTDIHSTHFRCLCNTCGREWPPYESKFEWLSHSFSPFWHEIHRWLPEMELLFHEPWSTDLLDLELLFLEPWSSFFPDLELLFHEPWSTDLLALELLFHEPWSSPVINLELLHFEPWSPPVINLDLLFHEHWEEY